MKWAHETATTKLLLEDRAYVRACMFVGRNPRNSYARPLQAGDVFEGIACADSDEAIVHHVNARLAEAGYPQLTPEEVAATLDEPDKAALCSRIMQGDASPRVRVVQHGDFVMRVPGASDLDRGKPVYAFDALAPTLNPAACSRIGTLVEVLDSGESIVATGPEYGNY